MSLVGPFPMITGDLRVQGVLLTLRTRKSRNSFRGPQRRRGSRSRRLDFPSLCTPSDTDYGRYLWKGVKPQISRKMKLKDLYIGSGPPVVQYKNKESTQNEHTTTLKPTPIGFIPRQQLPNNQRTDK